MSQLMEIAGAQKKMLEAGAVGLSTLGAMKIATGVVEEEYEEV